MPPIFARTRRIAALGIAALYHRNPNAETLMMLFRLATRDDAAVMTAIGSRIAEFSQFDARLPRCFTRIILVSAVRPRRRDTQAADRRAGKEYRRHLDDAIGAEQRWLEGQATEPDWPTLPIWPSRRRRGIRLGPAAREDDELTTRIAAPDVYIDEAIGTLVDHLADLGRGSVDEWRLNLAHHLLAWTVRANNGPPEDGEDHDREHRPDRWNAHFFYFLGFLCGAVAFERSQPLFLEPIIRLNDEAFHDALAPLLNGLDQATPLDRSGNPAQPAAVRALFAERLIRGRHWCYLAKEKSFAVEIRLGRALCAMFFHTPRMGVADPRPYLPPRCQRLPEFMPALVRVVSAAPLSGYVTDLFLGLIATYPTASLMRGLGHDLIKGIPESARE